MTALDFAYLGSRLIALLLGGRLIASLYQVPVNLYLLRNRSELTEPGAYRDMVAAFGQGATGQILLILLLGVACLAMWYKADWVARTVVGRLPSAGSGPRRTPVAMACSIAGWILVGLSLEGVARVVEYRFAPPLTSEGTWIGDVAPFLVLAVGILLVVGADRIKATSRDWPGDTATQEDPDP